VTTIIIFNTLTLIFYSLSLSTISNYIIATYILFDGVALYGLKIVIIALNNNDFIINKLKKFKKYIYAYYNYY